MSGVEAELERERAYVAGLYARLDELRARTADSLARVRRARASGSPQNRSERDAFATLHENRLAQLTAVEDRLCFGRLDLRQGERRYVGRLGLSDDEQRQLLVDWRAPAAREFYQATAASPGDVVRRRHLATRSRDVTGIEDELLDPDSFSADDRDSLTGEGALLAAVSAARTGRMGDIVATIQQEQDRVIRDDLAGVLVVQGGPGTGKTAVALHRAAYLLYTHRERLARSGVLLVGPSSVFLRYIEQVLPSLGETGVVMSTLGELFPGVAATATDPPEVAALKGDVRMAAVLAAAVRNRQRVPAAPQTLQVEGQTVVLRPEAVAAARGRARASGKPHNLARVGFVRELLDTLATQLARSLGGRLGDEDRADLLAELRGSIDVRRALNTAWLPLTPQQLLASLYADPARLAAASPALSRAERALLARPRDAPWTVADAPLLDEAAELLGEDDTAARLAARRAGEERRAELAYAREVLQGSGTAAGLVSAEALADRFADEGESLTVAERAARDRSWAYGHIVVDEAQELSPMAWRVLMRRCPSRSMTLVGDVAQTGSAAGARTWAAALSPHVDGRWRLSELTVNYRTPAQVMAVAAGVLAAHGIEASAPRSVRDGDVPPAAQRIRAGDADEVRDVVRAELAALGRGRLAVLIPRAGWEALPEKLAAGLPEVTAAGGSGALDAQVAVLTVSEAKGLEFDVVVLLEPAVILAEAPRGANDLYVALTRPTQRLRVLHSGDLPAGLRSLPSVGAGEVQGSRP